MITDEVVERRREEMRARMEGKDVVSVGGVHGGKMEAIKQELDEGLQEHTKLMATFLASAEDKMFLLGLSKDEKFLEFMKENYILGIDHGQDVKRLYRRKDGKVLISFKTTWPNLVDGHAFLMVKVIEDGVEFMKVGKRRRSWRFWRRK